MDDDDLPRRKGDAASKLAGEALDSYSVEELNERIQLCESEVMRIVAHRDRAKAHRVAADALFGGGGGSPATQRPDTR
jgi:uncharacterized small protein (DUF1192 family)